MPGLSRQPRWGSRFPSRAVRVAGSSTGATRATRPLNCSPGIGVDLTAPPAPTLTLLRSRLDEVRRPAAPSRCRRPTATGDVLRDARAGIDDPLGHEAVDRRGDRGVAELDAQFLEARLPARTAPARDRAAPARLVPRLGVVERLPGQKLRSNRLRARSRLVLANVEVGFALADGRPRDPERRFRLLDLLADLAGPRPWRAAGRGRRVAEPDAHGLQPPADLRHDVDGLPRRSDCRRP